MRLNRIAWLVLLLALVTSSTAAQKAAPSNDRNTPVRLVADLYRQHKRHSPFFQHTNRALVDRYFDRQVADLLWNIPDTPGEVGPLDGDPLYNAQDMEIKKFVIHPAKMVGDTARVLVTFTNFGKPQQINFVLVPVGSGWRISNIKYDDGTDLIGILKTN
ncbi:MAG TPA: DUF3828 domain-containing protein [Pyrinomonadaceae bacterium]|nr:DUF3828 domain-containing protein [Pyrinomonadaceae bacterium]